MEKVGATTKPCVMLISPDFGSGGSERSIAKLSLLLTKFCDVHFVVFNDSIKQIYPVGGIVHFLGVPAGKTIFGKVIRFFQRIIRTRRLKAKLNIDVAISFLEGSDYVNVSSRVNDQTLIIIRGSKESDPDIRGLLGWVRLRVLLPICIRKASRIIAVSAGIKDEIMRVFGIAPDRIDVIHNYYDAESILKKGEENLPPYATTFFDRPVVIASGRLHPSKNFYGLLQVAASLKKNRLRCRFLILGDGDLLDELIRQCGQLGLSHCTTASEKIDTDADVAFLGYQSNPWSFISRSDIFILPSLTEGFPNALAEAMCLGVPVIATDCPHGPREMLTGETSTAISQSVEWTENGVLVPLLINPQSVALCAEVIGTLLNDRTRMQSLASSASNRIAQFSETAAQYSWSREIQQLTAASRKGSRFIGMA